MNKLLIMAAAAVLFGAPLAAHAQDRDGWQGDGRDGARTAMARGRDADARVRDDRDMRFGRVDRDRFARDRFDRDRDDRFAGNRFDRDRFDRGRFGDRDFRDRDRFRGEFGLGLGFGYGGDYPYGGDYGDYYPYGGGDYGGYYDAVPYGGYGADYAYSYPDQYGTYAPFAYGYSDSDDAYDADDGPTYGGGYGGYGAGAAADCGRWVWRGGRGAYQWVPAACGRGSYGW